MILQEKVFFNQESIQPFLHGPSSQGKGAEGGQDNQCLNRQIAFFEECFKRGVVSKKRGAQAYCIRIQVQYRATLSQKGDTTNIS